MKSTRKSLFYALLLTMAPALSMAGIKCWTNSEGVRECGNAVPPEYAQKGHEQVNDQGMTYNKVNRGRTLDELEAARAAEREANAAAQIAAQEAERDRVLLATYSSVDDLELARDGQISHIESQIRITQDRIAKLQAYLDDKIERAGNIERRGKTPPAALLNEIASLRSQVSESTAFIDSKKREQSLVENQFRGDINRYRELKGIELSDGSMVQ